MKKSAENKYYYLSKLTPMEVLLPFGLFWIAVQINH